MLTIFQNGIFCDIASIGCSRGHKGRAHPTWWSAGAWQAPLGRRVLCGVWWNNNAKNLRSAKRNRQPVTNHNNNGFRVASTLRARAIAITVVVGEQESVQGRS